MQIFSNFVAYNYTRTLVATSDNDKPGANKSQDAGLKASPPSNAGPMSNKPRFLLAKRGCTPAEPIAPRLLARQRDIFSHPRPLKPLRASRKIAAFRPRRHAGARQSRSRFQRSRR